MSNPGCLIDALLPLGQEGAVFPAHNNDQLPLRSERRRPDLSLSGALPRVSFRPAACRPRPAADEADLSAFSGMGVAAERRTPASGGRANSPSTAAGQRLELN